MGSAGAYPLFAFGLARPVILLPCLQSGCSVANPPPPSSTGLIELHLDTVSDPSMADDVEEEMDASYSTLQKRFLLLGYVTTSTSCFLDFPRAPVI